MMKTHFKTLLRANHRIFERDKGAEAKHPDLPANAKGMAGEGVAVAMLTDFS
jgi:hypothetical protein